MGGSEPLRAWVPVGSVDNFPVAHRSTALQDCDNRTARGAGDPQGLRVPRGGRASPLVRRQGRLHRGVALTTPLGTNTSPFGAAAPRSGRARCSGRPAPQWPRLYAAVNARRLAFGRTSGSGPDGAHGGAAGGGDSGRPTGSLHRHPRTRTHGYLHWHRGPTGHLYLAQPPDISNLP